MRLSARAKSQPVHWAFGSLNCLGVRAEHTVTGGFAAAQMALLRGSRVIATAGDTFAEQLRSLGATVTPYGDGMVHRVLAITGAKAPDLVLDTAPVGGALPVLVEIAGDPKHVMTISDVAAAKQLGVRSTLDVMPSHSYDQLGDYAGYATDGRFTIPIARTYPLEDWRAALELSQNHKARGKIILIAIGETGP